MTKEQAEFIINVLEEDGIEAELREGYSGRGMYGKNTYGIVTNNVCDIIPALLRYSADNDVDIISDDLFDNFKLRQDSMGHDIVLY